MVSLKLGHATHITVKFSETAYSLLILLLCIFIFWIDASTPLLDFRMICQHIEKFKQLDCVSRVACFKCVHIRDERSRCLRRNAHIVYEKRISNTLHAY